MSLRPDLFQSSLDIALERVLFFLVAIEEVSCILDRLIDVLGDLCGLNFDFFRLFLRELVIIFCLFGVGPFFVCKPIFVLAQFGWALLHTS
mmetsp:Transcript_24979/g.31179  ORF Transcript_24979/g.31179 Transcript_24979/m.31179 type:complete len:91 (-) Transcript_24979:402-674(-)